MKAEMRMSMSGPRPSLRWISWLRPGAQRQAVGLARQALLGPQAQPGVGQASWPWWCATRPKPWRASRVHWWCAGKLPIGAVRRRRWLGKTDLELGKLGPARE
jgi:hypothetical protein